MKVSQIQDIAKEIGIKPGKLNKLNLIRAIQRKEGYFDCFATAYDGYCDQQSCAWRQDCFKEAKKALSS